MKPIDGACLCGACTISGTPLSDKMHICHCDMCRKWGGGPLMGVSGAEFEITGKELIRSYASSNWAERAFCSKCGSNLWFRFTPADNYSFLAGLFGGDLALSLEQQIQTIQIFICASIWVAQELFVSKDPQKVTPYG